MTYDAIEQNGLRIDTFKITDKLSALNKGFKSSLAPEYNSYSSGTAINSEISTSLTYGLGEVDNKYLMSITKGTWKGYDINGNKTLGLSEIADWKVNPEYRNANLRQHAGYAAEVITTQKENLIAAREKTGVTTYRVDDLPDNIREQFGDKFAAKNDQYVDKVRIKADGTYETVQTKFVGKTAKECFSKLKSAKYEKYLEDGKVDKMEIPKDHYEKIKTELIPDERIKLQNQLERMKSEGKADEIAKIEKKLDNLDKLDNKLEASTITSKQALNSVKAARAHKAGVSSAKQAAGLTAVVSGVENIQKYSAGEISGTEAIENVAKDTAIAGGVGYVTGAVTEFAGGSSVPAAVITMGVESYDDVKGYVEGDIDGKELAYNLGDNAARTAGGVAGFKAGAAAGALAGAKVGVVVGGVGGAATGAAVGGVVGGVAGSMGGSAVAAQAYEAGAEFVADNIDTVKDTAAEIADSVVETAANAAAEVKETAVEVKVAVADKLDDAADKAAEIKDAAAEKLNDAADKAAEVKDTASMTLKNAKVKVTNVIHKK